MKQHARTWAAGFTGANVLTAGDAGKGAAAGGVVGGLSGRRGSKRAEQATQKETKDSFQRAFAACMEARGHSVN